MIETLSRPYRPELDTYAWPLIGRLPPPERRGEVNGGKLETAFHEYNHARSAEKVGVPVKLISLNTTPPVLGVTLLGGHVDPEKFKVIAMGGDVHTPLGAAHGSGSDRFKAEMMAASGGSDVNSAKKAAERYIGSDDQEEREKVAEYIAYLGDVPGSWLPILRMRAQLELKREVVMHEQGIEITEEGQEQYTEQAEEPRGEETQAEYLENRQVKLIHLIDGEEVKSFILCTLCGMYDGHEPTCQYSPEYANELLKAKNSSEGILVFDKDTIKEYPILPENSYWN